jgi:hypothetical protein
MERENVLACLLLIPKNKMQDTVPGIATEK